MLECKAQCNRPFFTATTDAAVGVLHKMSAHGVHQLIRDGDAQ